MGEIIREIDGVKHVPAWEHEAGAVLVDGEHWRPLREEACVTYLVCLHAEDNQGFCHTCGIVMTPGGPGW